MRKRSAIPPIFQTRDEDFTEEDFQDETETEDAQDESEDA